MTTIGDSVPVTTGEPQPPPSRGSGVGPLLRFMLGRLMQMVLTLAILMPLTFFLFRLVPGDAASAVIGPDIDPAVADQLRERYGLNDSMAQQFLSYCRALLHGDLGTSFQYNLPVTEVLGERLLNSAVLVVPAVLLAVVLGVGIGAISATSRPAVDKSLGTLAFAVKSSPIFWVSTLALILFAFQLQVVPSIGMASPGNDADGLARFLSLDFLHHLVLPLTILVVYYLIEPMLTMRASMKEVLGQDFIEMGRAQGLSRRSIIFRHGARNGTLPVVTLAPALADNVIGGQVIVETVFSWPGMGRAVVEAVNNFDYPMMQGIFLVTALTVIVVNTLIDIVYAYLDPRVSL